MEIHFDANNYIATRIQRDVKSLFLELIYVLEDLKATRQIDDVEFQRLRKRILDRGNNVSRGLLDELDNFNLNLKNENDYKKSE